MKSEDSMTGRQKFVAACIVLAAVAGYFYWEDRESKNAFSRKVERSIKTEAALKEPAGMREISTKVGHLYEVAFNTDPMGIGFIEKQTCYIWSNTKLPDTTATTSLSCLPKTEIYKADETR